MNKTITKWFSALVMLLVASVGSFAQTLTIADFDINPGETKAVKIVLTSATQVYGVQSDVTLPAGLSLAADPAVIAATIEDGSDPTVVFNKLADNKYRVAAYSATGKAFKNAAAGLEIIELTVTAAEDFTNRANLTLSGSKVTTDDAGTQVTVPGDAAQADAQVYSYEIPHRFEFAPATTATAIRAYESDLKAATEVQGMQTLDKWADADGSARAAGVFTIGDATVKFDADAITAPATNAYGRAEGTALGLFAVWTATVQYTQDVALKAGTYYITIPVYNAGGTEAIVNNLIGVDAGAQKVYATTDKYAVGKWTVEKLVLTLAEDATVTFSLGYTAADKGVADMPHLFVQYVDVAKVATPDPLLATAEPAADKAYTIATETEGALIVKDGVLTTTMALSTPAAPVAANAADANQQFAFVKNAADGKVYLYSVGAKKFINLNALAAFDTAGGTTEAVTLAATNNVFYPTYVALNGTNVAASSTATPVIAAGNTEFAIVEAAAFDASEAQAGMRGDGLADGNYFFKNIATGKYFGPANSWGTHASLVDNPEYLALHKLANGKYNIETHVSNGGSNYYLNGVWMDGAASEIAIVDQGTYFTISSGDKYYGYDGEKTELVLESTDPADENVKWEVVAEADIDAYMAAATKDSPVNASFYIKDANFGRNNRDVAAWAVVASNKNMCGGEVTNCCAESWHSAFTITQTLTVRNGVYKVNAQAALTDYTNAYDGANYPVVFANAVNVPFNEMETADRGTSMSQLSNSFLDGKYPVSVVVTVTDGTLNIGVKGTRTDTWCIWDNFSLMYYGNRTTAVEVELGDIVAEVNSLREEAMTLLAEELMPAENVFELGHVYETTETIDPTQAAYEAAKTALTNAVDAAKAALANAKEVAEYIAKMEAILADTEAYTDEADAAATATAKLADVKNGTYGTDAEVAAAKKSALAIFGDFVAAVTFVKDVDVTDLYIVNANPVVNADGWTVLNGDGAAGSVNAFDKANNNAEFWNQKGYSINQTVSLPAGDYKLTAIAFTRTDKVATLAAGEASMAIATVASSEVNNRTQANTWFNAGNGVNVLDFTVAEAGDVTISLTADNASADYWLVWRSFKLEIAAAYNPCVGSKSVDVERYPSGSWETVVAVSADDVAAAAEALGAAAADLTFQLVETTGEVYTTYNADPAPAFWLDENGDHADWGTTNKFYVIYDAEAGEITTGLLPDVEAGFTGKATVRLANAEGQYYDFTINLTVVSKPVIDLKFDELNQIGDDVLVALQSTLGSYYEGLTADVDVAAILTTLGVENLSDVTIYAVQSDGSLDDDYKLNATDGWRNADGDFEYWGDDAYFYVKADFSLASAQIYEVGGMVGKNTDEPATYTATYVFVKNDTKDAVVLKVELSYVATGINGLNADSQNATIFDLNGRRVNNAQKGIYIVNGKKIVVK